MECKCKYFLRDENGVLRCVQCGAIAKPKDKIQVDNQTEIEDKMEAPSENKGVIYPTESKRITKRKKRR